MTSKVRQAQAQHSPPSGLAGAVVRDPNSIIFLGRPTATSLDPALSPSSFPLPQIPHSNRPLFILLCNVPSFSISLSLFSTTTQITTIDIDALFHSPPCLPQNPPAITTTPSRTLPIPKKKAETAILRQRCAETPVNKTTPIFEKFRMLLLFFLRRLLSLFPLALVNPLFPTMIFDRSSGLPSSRLHSVTFILTRSLLQLPWTLFERNVLHAYRREHRLNTPTSFSSPYCQWILSQPNSVGLHSPTMVRRRQARRQSKDQLALSVRKHFNGMGVQENDVIVDFIYKIRHDPNRISKPYAGGKNTTFMK